jgi:uncharacterized membrane protein YdjX (TVP38/TMEM64 family)
MPFNKNCLLLALAAISVSLLYYNFYHLLSFENLHHHKILLSQWKDERYFLTVCLFIIIYSMAVLISFPAVSFLALVGGFLFHLLPGIFYSLFSVVFGSTLLFISIRSWLSPTLLNKAKKWFTKIESRFNQHPFTYLLILRLIPIFPAWAVNIISGVIKLRLNTFMGATFLGVIPNLIIFTSLGQSLGDILSTNELPSFSIIFQPRFFLPLLSLALLAALPIYLKHIKKELI